MKYLSLETVLEWQEMKVICISTDDILKLANGRKKISWNEIMNLPIPKQDKIYLASLWIEKLYGVLAFILNWDDFSIYYSHLNGALIKRFPFLEIGSFIESGPQEKR